MLDRPLRQLARRVLLTGATGFLGTAILEALLRTTDADVTLLVRPTPSASAEDRIDALLHSEAFAPLRAALGLEAVAQLRARITVLSGDLSSLTPPTAGAAPAIQLPTNLDTVIHSASRVSFDDSWGQALATNVHGPAALYRALGVLGQSAHVIHISTAYVNAGRTKVGTEQSVKHNVDWHTECERIAEDHELATDPAAGRRHAHAHGWTDVYTFSKALGERVAEDEWAGRGHRLTIVRPTIIESALTHPYPGWLDGFKVADPLIAAYAEGRMEVFPGRAGSIIDIVPVDAVADTVLAAIDRPARSGQPDYFQPATSRINPLRLRELRPRVDAALASFGQHGAARRISPSRRLRFHREGVIRLGLAVHRLKLDMTESRTGPSRRTQMRRRALDRFARYVTLYGPYTTNVTTFEGTGAQKLLGDHAAVGHEVVDLAALDWQRYFTANHIPALARQRRWAGHEEAVTDQAKAVARITTPAAAPAPAAASAVSSTVVPAASPTVPESVSTPSWPEEVRGALSHIVVSYAHESTTGAQV